MHVYIYGTLSHSPALIENHGVSILKERKQGIQNLASKESSILAMTSHSLLSIFKKDLHKCLNILKQKKNDYCHPALTALIFMGYTSQIVIESSLHGIASNESSLIFGLLCSTYLLFYNFATDLNDPFGEKYQVRHSATASHLLKIKWHMINDPMLRGQIDFSKLQKKWISNIETNIINNKI